MNSRHLPSLIFFAALGGAPCSIAAPQATSPSQVVEATPELIVQGRIIQETAEPLPQTPGYVLLASMWTYHVRVTKVIAGSERRREIIAFRDADPALLTDRDLIFRLTRRSDGTYDLKRVDRAG